MTPTEKEREIELVFQQMMNGVFYFEYEYKGNMVIEAHCDTIKYAIGRIRDQVYFQLTQKT